MHWAIFRVEICSVTKPAARLRQKEGTRNIERTPNPSDDAEAIGLHDGIQSSA
jgi:hypothetical protein